MRLECEKALLVDQSSSLKRIVGEMQQVIDPLERDICLLENEKNSLQAQLRERTASFEADLDKEMSKKTELKTQLDESVRAKEFLIDAFRSEVLFLGDILLDSASLVWDIKSSLEASLHRDLELQSEIDSFKSQQQVIMVMMERIRIALAVHADGQQAWRCLESALSGSQVFLPLDMAGVFVCGMTFSCSYANDMHISFLLM